MNPKIRRHWESGPRFELGRGEIEAVERGCLRVSDGETEAHGHTERKA